MGLESAFTLSQVWKQQEGKSLKNKNITPQMIEHVTYNPQQLRFTRQDEHFVGIKKKNPNMVSVWYA